MISPNVGGGHTDELEADGWLGSQPAQAATCRQLSLLPEELVIPKLALVGCSEDKPWQGVSGNVEVAG